MTRRPPVATPIEVELKYLVLAPDTAEEVLAAERLADLVGEPGGARQLAFEDRYLDTGDGALARSGFAARLRTTPEGTIVSVKSTSSAGGPDGATHRREEREGPAVSSTNAADWPPSDARDLVLRLVDGAELQDRLTVRQQRRRRHFRGDASVVELSLDSVEVEDGGVVVDRWTELEAEMVEGDEAALDRLAAELAGNASLAPVETSKLERATAALERHRGTPVATPSEPAVVEPATPGVRADDDAAEAGRKVIAFHFARMLAREPGARSGANSRDLHAMRVATRRMRAAWRVFGFAFSERETRRLRRDLRDIARALGAVRDPDVLLEGLDAYAAGRSPAEAQGLEPLAAAWRAERDAARVRLIRALDHRRYARLVREYGEFLGDTSAPSPGPGSLPEPRLVRETAPSRIWAAFEHVRAYEPVLESGHVETLHELRIAAKWLRYSLEFVREPLGREVEEVIPMVVALQDHLGLLHDADVSAGRARTFLSEAPHLEAGERGAIEAFAESRAQDLQRLVGAVAAPWQDVTGAGTRKRLGRAVARL